MDALRSEALHAIQQVRAEIRWRSGSLTRHLQKRKMRGHLPQHATAAVIETQTWLVMFDRGGWMESAFVVESPQHYLSKSAFEPIGSLTEIISL